MHTHGFWYGTLGLCTSISVALVPLTFIPFVARGEASSPEAFSNLIVALLLPVAPGFQAYPNLRAVIRVTAAGVVCGLFLILGYYHLQYGDYLIELEALGTQVGWSTVAFYIYLGTLAAVAGVAVGWHINYLVIVLAKHFNKDWP